MATFEGGQHELKCISYAFWRNSEAIHRSSRPIFEESHWIVRKARHNLKKYHFLCFFPLRYKFSWYLNGHCSGKGTKCIQVKFLINLRKRLSLCTALQPSLWDFWTFDFSLVKNPLATGAAGVSILTALSVLCRWLLNCSSQKEEMKTAWYYKENNETKGKWYNWNHMKSIQSSQDRIYIF